MAGLPAQTQTSLRETLMLNKIAKLPKIWSVVLLALFIVFLYVFLQKGITPFVLKVVESDLFFEKEDEKEELGQIRNERTGFAFTQCKTAMKNDKHVPETAQFADADYEAWALGGKTYLIRSHVNVPGEKGLADRKYACKIKFAGGDMSDAGNWDMLGIDFHSSDEGE
jgi:hypothetical protein